MKIKEQILNVKSPRQKLYAAEEDLKWEIEIMQTIYCFKQYCKKEFF